MQLPDHINGPRVTLRQGHEVDPTALFNLVMASKTEVAAFLPWALKYTTIQNADDSIARFKKLWDEGTAFTYAIYSHDNTLVGMVDWRPKADWWGTIGYWLGTPYTGQGYMAAAVDALVNDFFQRGIHRAVIQCDTRNQPSAAVAKRAGFVYEGHLRQDRRNEDGSFHDSLQFARLATDAAPQL
jgi:RimJ/RimL family protein N-acetyltransferase